MSALWWPSTRPGAACAPPGRLLGRIFAPGVAHTAGGLESFAPGRAPARSSVFKGRGRWVKGSVVMAGKSALVPIGTGSEEMEAVIIIDVLRRAGVEVTVASVEDSLQVEMSRKVKLVADRMIGECAGCSYDVVALPGGMPGAERLSSSEPLMDIVRKQKENDKHIWAAICAAPAVAFEGNGLLKGRRATAHPAFSDKLSNQSAVSSRVVVDGTLVTSRGPGTAFEFALALVSELYGPEKAEEVAGPMVMYPYQPSKAFAAA